MATTTSMQKAAAAHFGYTPPAPSAPSGGGGSAPPIYSNPSELPVGSPGYNPAWTPQGGGSLPAAAATITGEEYLASGFYGGQTISPIVPKAITPESSIAGIQSVFGEDWTPATAFTPELQAKGIYGAVRIKDTNEVYSLGTGGSKAMSAADYFNTFKTSEQEGIVGEISREEAVKLGIPLTGKTPVATNAITTEALSTKAIDLEIGTETNISEADGFKAYMEEYLKQQESLKSQSEKDTEKKVDDITTQLEELLKEGADQGAIQAAEEEKREIEDQQKLVDDANGDLSMKMAEIDALAASYNLENQIVEGKTISLARMQGQQAQNYKMYLAQKNLLTSEAGLLQAKALALQGKLDSAQTAADRATDLKYSSWVTEVNNATSLLTLLEGKLSKDETIRADAMKYYYDRIDTQIADQKATEKQIQSIMINLAGKAPSSILSKVSNATSVLEAMQIANPYLAGGDEELTGIDAAVDDAAREIIGMESFNLSTNESYWGIIDELATDSGMDRNYLDKLVIQKIQQVKGQPAETIQEVEENIGSDFESPTTSSTISGAGLASGQQDIQKQLQEQQVSGDQKRINDEKIRKARQDAIDNGLVFWINPITGQRKLTSQE